MSENENGPVSEMLFILHVMHNIVLDDKAWDAVAPHIFKPGAPLQKMREDLHAAVDRQGLMLQMTQQIMQGLSGIQPPADDSTGGDQMPGLYQMPARKLPETDDGPGLLFG